MEKGRQLKWKVLPLIELEGLHSMANKQKVMVSLKEGLQGGRRWEVACSRIVKGGWKKSCLQRMWWYQNESAYVNDGHRGSVTKRSTGGCPGDGEP